MAVRPMASSAAGGLKMNQSEIDSGTGAASRKGCRLPYLAERQRSEMMPVSGFVTASAIIALFGPVPTRAVSQPVRSRCVEQM